jgi:hypothetical protein
MGTPPKNESAELTQRALYLIQCSEVDSNPCVSCCSYALGITGRLSGLVSSFTETEKELVAVERVTQYISNIKPENAKGTSTEDTHSGNGRFLAHFSPYFISTPLCVRVLSERFWVDV